MVCNQNVSNSHGHLNFVLNTFGTPVAHSTFFHFGIIVKPGEQYRPIEPLVMHM